MRKTRMSKVLSLLLALTMVIGCLPQTVIFAAGDGVVTYEFNTTIARYGAVDVDYTVSGNYTYARSLKNYYNSATHNRDWRYFADTLLASASANAAEATAWVTNGSGFYIEGSEKSFKDNWVAIKVQGLTAGRYKITVNKPTNNKGCVWGMYVLDGNTYANATVDQITAAIGTELGEGVQKVGEGDSYGNATTLLLNGAADISSADEQVLVFKAERAGALDTVAGVTETSSERVSREFIAISQISFEKIEALKEITATDINAVVGDEIKPEESITWIGVSGEACGGEKVFEKIELVKNDNGAVLAGSDGGFYAVAPGSATIKVTGKLASGEGGSKSAEIEVSVAESSRDFAGETLFFDFASTKVLAKEKGITELEFANAAQTAIVTSSLDDYFKSDDGS